MADVFLSYARSDAAIAKHVAGELEKVGWSVWLDRELPAHLAYSDVIATELETAAAVLVLWSKAAAESEWVRSEANRARELHKLVQARVDDARLPMPFDQTQCADLTVWRGAGSRTGWLQVCKSIDALLGGNGVRAIPSAPARVASRRGMLIGGAAAVASTVAGGWFWLRDRNADHPSPEAALLLQKGIDTLQSDDVFAADNPGSLRDAIALLTEATQKDSRSSTAWGSLALAYAALKRVSPGAERPGLASRSQSAADKAFEIDANEPRAVGAMLLVKPLYRNWLRAERADRKALNKVPQRVPLLLFVMSEMLRSVGRCKEAAAVSIKFDRNAFIIPGADEQVLLDLWSAGDLRAADDALRLAMQHWPQHPQVWRTRIAYLMYSGRASEALALLHDETGRPVGTPDAFVQVMNDTATALSNQSKAPDAVSHNLAYLKANPLAVFPVVHACAALGDGAAALAILQGYYFGEGSWADVAPPNADEDRKTDFLFQPPMTSQWRDSHFDRLLERIGLNAYWHQSGTVPDFRKNVLGA